MGYFRYRGDIEYLEARITERFRENQPGVIPDGRGKGCRVAGINESRLDPEPGQRIGQQVVAAAIQRAGSDNMRAGAHQRDNRQVQCRLATGRCNGADAAFECRDALLQHGVGGVAQARIDMSGTLHVEQGRGVIRIGEGKRGGLVNRCSPGPRRRVWLRPGVQGQGVQSRVFWSRHGVLLFSVAIILTGPVVCWQIRYEQDAVIIC